MASAGSRSPAVPYAPPARRGVLNRTYDGAPSTPARGARGPLIVVTRNLPPLTGGMERLTQHFVSALAGGHELVVIGPPGCGPHVDETVRCFECGSSRAGPFVLQAMVQALRCAVRSPRPALFVAASGLTAPIAWLASRLCRTPYVVVVHGLDLVVEHNLYRRLFLPAVRRSTMVIANSRNTAAIARATGVTAERIQIVNPGVTWAAHPIVDGAFRRQHKLGTRPVLLSVGRLTARKGLAEFITHAMPAIVAAVPDVVLVIVGGEASDAIRPERSVIGRVRDAIGAARLENNIVLAGPAGDEGVEQAYAGADVFVFPLVAVAGDVEGFGMVAAEAAAHGVRTVAFDEGGVADAMVVGTTGEMVAPGDYPDFAAKVISELALCSDPGRREACHRAAERFSWGRYAEEIGEVFARFAPPEDPANGGSRDPG